MKYKLSDGVIVVETDRAIRQDVDRLYEKQYGNKTPSLNSRTVHIREISRKAGILGELVFAELYKDARKSEDYAYDFYYQGKRVDVKCKYRNGEPDYRRNESSIYMYQVNNEAVDIYYFMSTCKNFEKVWLMGCISRSALLHHPQAVWWKKGDIDPSNKKVFEADTLNLPYIYLVPISIEQINPRVYHDW